MGVHFRAKMLKAQRKGTASFNYLGGEETKTSEMFLKGGKREHNSNRVVRNHNVEGEKSVKVEKSSKGRVVVEKRVVQSLADTRRRVDMNNSAENRSVSSTEEESDEKEDLANFTPDLVESEDGVEATLASVEKDLAAVRARLLRLEAGKLAALDGITETDSEKEKGFAKEEECSSQSDAEEFFGINQEGKAVARASTKQT